MNVERVFSLKNRWFTASVGGVLLVAVIAALIGFIWIPRSQSDRTITGMWDAICTAAGVPVSFRAPILPPDSITRPSNVIVTAQMMAPADSLSIGRGGTLALQCTMCHGVRGMSQADSPNLAGQGDAAIYKQLRDFKSGHRKSVVMEAVVAHLGDQEMRDLAAYYNYLPREHNVMAPSGDPKSPVLVSNGAPMRNIGACVSCHGSMSSNTATPLLDGEPKAYMRAQLQAFSSGARRNDINQQMRNVARQMTPAEIEAVSHYYANRP